MDNSLKKFGSIACPLGLPNKWTHIPAELSAACQSRTPQDFPPERVYRLGLRRTTAHLPEFLFSGVSTKTAACHLTAPGSWPGRGQPTEDAERPVC